MFVLLPFLSFLFFSRPALDFVLASALVPAVCSQCDLLRRERNALRFDRDRYISHSNTLGDMANQFSSQIDDLLDQIIRSNRILDIYRQRVNFGGHSIRPHQCRRRNSF